MKHLRRRGVRAKGKHKEVVTKEGKLKGLQGAIDCLTLPGEPFLFSGISLHIGLLYCPYLINEGGKCVS